LDQWTEKDAETELGPPLRHRDVFGPDGVVYAYENPTRGMREIELNFDKASGRLVAIYGYPWNLTWDQYKQQMGDHGSERCDFIGAPVANK